MFGSMVTDLAVILAILVLLLVTSIGSYYFLSYCFPDANYANIDSEQLNREVIFISDRTELRPNS